MLRTPKILLVFFLFMPTAVGLSMPAQEQEIAQIMEDINQSVVTIIGYDAGKNEIGRGKGVIVSSDGLVLTNYHLLCQARRARARLAGGKIFKKVDWEDVFYPGFERDKKDKAKERKSKGKEVDVEGVVAVDKSLNFALIKIKGRGLLAARLAPSAQLTIGDRANIVVDDESLSEASITGISSLLGDKTIARISLSLPPEMNGSPVFNDQGEVIGLASSVVAKSNVIVPALYAQPLIQEGKVTSLEKMPSEDYFVTGDGLYLKSVLHAVIEDYPNALALAEEAVKANPSSSDALIQKGFLHAKLNQYSRAAEAYEAATRLDPGSASAFYGLGMAYIRLNQPQKAIEPLTRCTAIDDTIPEAFYNLGMAFEAADQLEDAAVSYQRFIAINPGPAWTGLNQLGSVYVKLGHYDKAIGAFEEVLKSHPSDLKATYNLAYAYDMSGQYARAAPLYEKLITLNPRDAKSYYALLFRLYDKAGDYDKAILVAKEILKQAPDSAQDHYNLGIMYFKKEDFKNALSAFNAALQLNPNLSQVYYNIGLVHFKQEKYAEAVKAFTRFTEFEPDNADALYNIGAGYLQMKKYEQALVPLQKAIELRPDYVYAHYNLGIAYYVLGDRFSATQQYKTLQNLNTELADKLYQIIKK